MGLLAWWTVAAVLSFGLFRVLMAYETKKYILKKCPGCGWGVNYFVAGGICQECAWNDGRSPKKADVPIDQCAECGGEMVRFYPDDKKCFRCENKDNL